MESYRTRIKDKLEDAAYFVLEALFFVPFDLATVKIRDVVIPRFIKKKIPLVACRGRGNIYTDMPDSCRPAGKYTHNKIFGWICRHYNTKEEVCRKYCRHHETSDDGLARACAGCKSV